MTALPRACICQFPGGARIQILIMAPDMDDPIFNMSPSLDTPLWTPKNPAGSAALRFLASVNITYGLSLNSYHDLYTWSVTHLEQFWSAAWDYTDIIGHKGNHVIDSTALPPSNPPWFADARLNWAENMLQCRSPDKLALIQASRCHIFQPSPSTIY